MKRALIVRHHAAETLARNFRSILDARGFELQPLNVFESGPRFERFSPPEIGDIDLVMAFGGPMSVNDDYPAFHQEREFFKEAMARDIPVFGVCLGAQMMATALGGSVEPSGGYQFGLRKIDVTAEGDADPVFGKISVPLVPTLHGECFTVPDVAVKLADGHILCRDGCFRRINMSFRYKNSYAFQFEPQLTLEELIVWNQQFADDYRLMNDSLMGDRFDPEEEAARNLREFAKFAAVHEAQMAEMLVAFLTNAGLD
jgi:GMP synthase-like glutamine amidotransferase